MTNVSEDWLHRSVYTLACYIIDVPLFLEVLTALFFVRFDLICPPFYAFEGEIFL